MGPARRTSLRLSPPQAAADACAAAWSMVEQTPGALETVLLHLSAPADPDLTTPEHEVAYVLARAAEVSRVWHASSSSNKIWQDRAESAVGKSRYPMVVAMKSRPECMATWKQLCVQFIAVELRESRARAAIHFDILRSDSDRWKNYMVGVTVEQQGLDRSWTASGDRRRKLILSSLVDFAGPHNVTSEKDLVAEFEGSSENHHVLSTDWDGTPLTVAIVLMRNSDGKLCSLGTARVFDYESAELDEPAVGAQKGYFYCSHCHYLPSIMTGKIPERTDNAEAWAVYITTRVMFRIVPHQRCTCQECIVEDTWTWPWVCKCDQIACWSLEGVELAMDSMDSGSVIAGVDDMLRVLESQPAEHLWV